MVGAARCAQFAVTKAQIRKRPKEYYEKIRQWLIETPRSDSTSGRILEWSWHSTLSSFPLAKVRNTFDPDTETEVMFGKPSVDCPDAATFYCKTFSLCDLKCSHVHCNSQYILPPCSTLPTGWPVLGWKREQRKIGVPG